MKNNGGDLYIAAYGIVNRITLVLFFIVFGINMGMQPIVGYNYGAGKFDRIKQVLRICIFSATIITTIGFLLGMIIPTQLVRAFTTDESLIQVTTHALRIFILAFPVIGFQMIVSNLFQSMKMPHKSIFLSISRQLLFLIPLLYLLPSIWGVDGVWISIPVADVISTIIAAILLYMQMKKLKGSSLNTSD